jgi:hypothetical protein
MPCARGAGVSGDALGEVIIEVTRVGDVQRVAAVHVASGVEVVIQAPGNAALVDVRALVLKKLERTLNDDAPPPSRPGKLV